MRKNRILKATLCAVFVALTAVCSWLTVPAAVPFTMQTFAVFATVGLLGGKLGTVSVVAYIAAGLVGLPVFSGFAGGYAAIIGPTGGYIVGFVVMAAVMWGASALTHGSDLGLIIGMLAGLAALYMFGTAWFVVMYTNTEKSVGFYSAFSMCVLPFIIPDLLKAGLAFIAVKRLRGVIAKATDRT